MKNVKLRKVLEAHQLWLTSMGAKGNRADFRGEDLSLASLDHASLSYAYFDGVNLERASFYKSDLRHASFVGAIAPYAYFENANICDALCDMADFTAASFFGAQAKNARFCRANLHNANFARAEAIMANFSGADLHGMSLRHTNAKMAVFDGANLFRTEFTRADIAEADFGAATVIQLGPLGSRREYMTVTRHRDGTVAAQTGCFWGNLEELEASALERHGSESQYLQEYQAAITYCRALFAARRFTQ